MSKHKMFHVKHFASHISLATSPRDTASPDDAFFQSHDNKENGI